MTRLSAWLVTGCLLASAAAAGPPPAAVDAPAAPPAPPVLDDWLPQTWWQPIDIVPGRVDGDALDDMVVVLERPADAPEDPRWQQGSRALFVLFQDPDSGWRAGPLVPGILPCATCTGTLSGVTESAIFDLDIPEPGIIEVAWVHRRFSSKAVRLRLGWDEDRGDIVLLSDDVSVHNPYAGRSRVRRDYRRGLMWVDGKPQSIPPRTIPMEQVSADAY